MLELAATLGASRVEIPNVDYCGWALENGAGLMPTPGSAGRHERHGRIIPRAPVRAAGMRRLLNMLPSGLVLPCHAAETIPALRFDNAR